MKRLILALAVVCFTFYTHVTATDTKNNDSVIEESVLHRLCENDSKDIGDVVLNSSYEAYKATFKANDAFFKAKLKDVQSCKVYVTKSDLLKTYSIEANKSRNEAYEALARKCGLDESSSKADNLATQDTKEMKYAKFDAADANAAKTYGILYETETENIKPSSNEAIKLYNEAAKFYDNASKAYGDIVTACSSTNPAISRVAEKVKSTKEYAKYESYIAGKRKAAEFWAKEQTYAKKLKEVSDAYAKVAAIRIELADAAKTYAKVAKTYDKAAKTYAKAAKSSIELPEADRLCCFKFEDAVELHKAHKISDAQLASVPATKASGKTIDAYGAYCRTNFKLMEAIVAACCVEDEAVKLKTELSKSSLEQAQDIVKSQVECFDSY